MNKILGIGFILLSLILNPLFAQNTQKKFVISKAPACPYPFEHKQNDGRKVSIKMTGDGYVHQDYTLDGYTVLLKDGQYEYAILDKNNQLIPSGIPAANSEERTQEEKYFLDRVTKDLRFHHDQILDRKISSQEKTLSVGNTAAFPSKGKNKMLIILIDFPDMPHKFSKEDFERLANEENYNGVGSVRDYYLKNLFMPFFSTKKEGTGLGLSICYNIIKNHQGTIDVESQISKGTTFTIKLPFIKESLTA